MLMEVLVAVGILTFGIIYISRAYMSCLNAMAQVANYTTAVILGEEKLFELETKEAGVSQTNESGNFSTNPNFNYDLEIKKLVDLDLNDIFLNVNWKEGKRSGSIEIVSEFLTKSSE